MVPCGGLSCTSYGLSGCGPADGGANHRRRCSVAGVAFRAGHSVNEDQLRAHARKLLADYKVPERILFLAELPKGLTGKVDRRSLRDILIAQADVLKQRLVSGV